MEEVKSYVNKDLFGRSYEDFCKALNLGVDLEEEPIDGKIEWALMLLDSKIEKIRESEADGLNINLKTFDGCNLFVDRVGIETEKTKGLSFLKPSETGLNLNLFNNQFNSKILSFNNYVSLSRHKQLSIEEKRNITKNPLDQIIRRDFAYYNNNEKWYSFSQNFKAISVFEVSSGIIKEEIDRILEEMKLKRGNDVTVGDKRYSWEGYVKNMDKNFLYPVPNDKNFHITKQVVEDFFQEKMYFQDYVQPFQTSISTELTYFYEWHLYIRENEKSIGFKIPISPTAFKDVSMFKNLERNGDSRKKAILHFVKEHYRSKINATEEERQVLVNRYLRGETKFNWNGLEVHLIPSKHDIQQTKSRKKFITV